MAIASSELEENAADAALAAQSVAETAPAEIADAAIPAEQQELFAQADARRDLRRKVDKVEMRLAVRDLVEGVRGLVRVAPFTAVIAGMFIGASLARRSKGRRRPAPRR